MRKILIFSGAGLSAESGISTFRDANGLWEGHDPNFVANIYAFPLWKKETFDFYNDRREQLATVEPNAAHIGIAELQYDYGEENVLIFTQNVDDLLERAGCTNVQHVHGDLKKMMCLEEKCGHEWNVGYSRVELGTPCPRCGSTHNKPAVVFFGEGAPLYRKMYKTFGESTEDLIIVIGTSGEVIPLAAIVGNNGTPQRSKSVLNNLAKTSYVDTTLFDVCLFKPATQAWKEIRSIADQFSSSHSSRIKALTFPTIKD